MTGTSSGKISWLALTLYLCTLLKLYFCFSGSNDLETWRMWLFVDRYKNVMSCKWRYKTDWLIQMILARLQTPVTQNFVRKVLIVSRSYFYYCCYHHQYHHRHRYHHPYRYYCYCYYFFFVFNERTLIVSEMNWRCSVGQLRVPLEFLDALIVCFNNPLIHIHVGFME